MRIQSGREAAFGQRILSVAGTLWVVASCALLSAGVRIARAEDRPVAPSPMAAPSPAPAAAPTPDPAPKASPFVRADDVEQARRPGVSGIETAPGVIVLNTRGYNYGPPPTPLAPEALEHEKSSR